MLRDTIALLGLDGGDDLEGEGEGEGESRAQREGSKGEGKPRGPGGEERRRALLRVVRLRCMRT